MPTSEEIKAQIVKAVDAQRRLQEAMGRTDFPAVSASLPDVEMEEKLDENS